jgi:hypothetical protein
MRANLNIHLHCLMLDGVYRLTDDAPVFQTVPAPTPEQLQTLLTRIIKRVLKVLIREGALIEEAPGTPYLADTDRNPALTPLQAAACTYRIALFLAARTSPASSVKSETASRVMVLDTITHYGILNIVPARQLFRYKGRQGDVIVDMVIWVLPEKTVDRPHGFKYRLHCSRGARCVVRYDNETGKGDHRHYSEDEEPYQFESMDKLIADFRRDCTCLTGWRWE